MARRSRASRGQAPVSVETPIVRVDISFSPASGLRARLAERAPAETPAPVAPPPEDTALSERLARAERELAEAREKLGRVQPPDAVRDELHRRAERLAGQEEVLAEQRYELAQREAALEEREAKLTTDLVFREEQLEDRERRLEDLEGRLQRRESDLTAYVAQLQGRIGELT
jgi:hypothetical protein